MKTPEWLKPGLLGAAAGAVGLAIIGFGWGGWVTGGKAEAMAASRAHVETVSALVPFCVALSQTDPLGSQTLADIAAARSYQRADILMKAGWATMPGAESGDRDLAKACAVELSSTT